MLSFNELRYLAHNTKRAADDYTDASRPGGVNNPDFRMDAVEAARGRGSSERQQKAQAETDAVTNNDRMGYGKAIGTGAGAGALAGIPIALLAHALMADPKKKSLRDYLKSGLLGGLIGGGAGALAGGGLRALLKSDPEAQAGLLSRLEKGKADDFMAPQAMQDQYLMNAYKPQFGLKGMNPFNPYSEADMELAEQGSIGIPGMTADYYGLPPGKQQDGIRGGGLNFLQDAFTR